MQPDTKKAGRVKDEGVIPSHDRSRSHHVEVVLARVFAKQHGDSKQKHLQQLDSEDDETDLR